MRLLLPCFLLLLSSCAHRKENPALIPLPASFSAGEGSFLLDSQTQIRYSAKSAEWLYPAQFLEENLRVATSFPLPVSPLDQHWEDVRSNCIWLVQDARIAHPEGYLLEVKPGSVWLRAATPAGAFYGIQTLLQSGPPELFNSFTVYDAAWRFPACRIEDHPRFGYRGLHLDVARHFFPVSFIKKYIDLLARHKMNVFHWHLTDDQGWRIEIKKYPLLTQIGGCRTQTLLGHYEDEPRRYDGQATCGYYTQEEIKEVTAYAQRRFVTIVPEIELPGHALAALTAYPHLGCTGGPYQVRTEWGVSEEVFCVGNDSTFVFLKNVLDEVCALFPGPYIHIGGDECLKDRWKVCAKCQKRIRVEKLTDEQGLQSYCIGKVSEIIKKHGKKMIGWDEIAEGGLVDGALVMSWRGTEGGIAAAKMGHEVIMTPGSHCYFDFYQGDPAGEPTAIGGYTPIEKVYDYEPVPDTLAVEYRPFILGAQGNVWTEYITNAAQAEYMAYPRACALADVLWTPPDRRQRADFFRRIVPHFERLDRLGVRYARSFYDVAGVARQGQMELSCQDSQAIIRYTEDGQEPHTGSKRYRKPFTPHHSGTVRARAFTEKTALGKTTSFPFQVHKALGKPYTLSYAPDRYTGGGPHALTDGQTGAARHWAKWVGLVNHDFDPVIDLGRVTSVKRVVTHFIDNKASWIYPPRSVGVWLSKDGSSFTQVASVQVPAASGQPLQTVVMEWEETEARYVRLVASAFGVIPEGAAGAGNGAWLFIDEVAVE